MATSGSVCDSRRPARTLRWENMLNGKVEMLFRRIAQPLGLQKSMLATKQSCDMIGPPNPVSNLRPVKYAVKENETRLEKLLREEREALQAWNEEFWVRHNTNFIKQKEEFIKSRMRGKSEPSQGLNADEMSVFYKNFLNENWKNHFNYNLSWHKRNVYVTFLDFQVRLQRLFGYPR